MSTLLTDFDKQEVGVVLYQEQLVRESDNSLTYPMPPGFTIGCDPEFFVVDRNSGGIIKASELTDGRKNRIEKSPSGLSGIHADGFALELNIKPAKNLSEFQDHLYDGWCFIEEKLNKFGGRISREPIITIPEKVFNDAHPWEQQLGCNPDFNAWSNRVNPPPVCANPYMRTAGGHIHIGLPQSEEGGSEHANNCIDLVRQLDYWLGLWEVEKFQSEQLQTRKLMYGQAGAMRIKPYGVEYRTLSNAWFVNTESWVAAYHRTRTAITQMRICELAKEVSEACNESVINCLNSGESFAVGTGQRPEFQVNRELIPPGAENLQRVPLNFDMVRLSEDT